MAWRTYKSSKDNDDLTVIVDPEERRKKAWNTALRKISSRERSSIDLRKYLESRSFESEIIDSVMKELIEKKWIDDERYAQTLVRHQGNRGKGPSYIQRKLREKGLFLKADEISSILFEAQGKSEAVRAREIIERKYPGYSTDLREKKKAFEALVRRGFSFDTAKKAVSKDKLE